MKIFQKYGYWILGSIILILVAFCGVVKETLSEKLLIPFPYFCIETENGQERISLFCGDDENYYVFLPSYADMDRVSVWLSSKDSVCIGETKLSDGMLCSEFELEKNYEFSINEQFQGMLLFYKAENVSTMYIDTESGSMKYLHDDKNHEETISINLYENNGTLNYSDKNSKMKGRGNSTWNYDKRPYTLTLSSEADLLDMGAATKWILLANAREESNLNNKIIFHLASSVDMEWTPEIRWVDLYLNGEYNGLYLLTEKVESGENRLDINIEDGDFLGKIDYENRWNTLNHPFKSKAGRTVEISNPEVITEKEKNSIINLTNQLEDIILLGENLDKYSKIDLDSWVCRYLIDEISGNIDADLASSYFYYKDGVFYAGPIWDYDAVLGNENFNQEPHAFLAKNYQKSSSELSIYYNALYNNESFHNRMVEIYCDKFLPVLEQLLEHGIDELAAEINKSSQMNSLRWKTMYAEMKVNNEYYVWSIEQIKEYLEQRIHFLNSTWIDNIDYCTIQFENSLGNKYWNVSVKKGEHLETNYVDLINTDWIIKDNDEKMDFAKPINEDLVLVRANENVLLTRDYVTLFSVAMLMICLSGFITVELYRISIRRRN